MNGNNYTTQKIVIILAKRKMEPAFQNSHCDGIDSNRVFSRFFFISFSRHNENNFN